jgi:hypothetical protein
MKRNQQAKTRRLGRWWLVACLLLAVMFAGKSLITPPASASFKPSPSANKTRHPGRTIENIRVGQRVVTQDRDGSAERTAVDPATWRKVALRAEWRWTDGTLDDINVETLQPPEWIAAHHAQVGATVPLPLDLEDPKRDRSNYCAASSRFGRPRGRSAEPSPNSAAACRFRASANCGKPSS